MRLKSYLWLALGLILLALAGCGADAVVFAPTPAPEDLTPIRYDHPSGAFSVSVPRHWSLYEQNTTTLATAAFAAPGADEPAILFAVINLGRTVIRPSLPICSTCIKRRCAQIVGATANRAARRWAMAVGV